MQGKNERALIVGETIVTLRGDSMNRIPKYRAWDKVNQMMIDNIISINFYNRTITFFDKDANTNVSMDFDDIILMQSTGLKRGRKEVYEGDILRGSFYFRGVGWYDTGEGDHEIDDPVEYTDGKFVCGGFDLADVVGDSHIRVVGHKHQ